MHSSVKFHKMPCLPGFVSHSLKLRCYISYTIRSSVDASKESDS